jgi:hypothetical protein
VRKCSGCALIHTFGSSDSKSTSFEERAVSNSLTCAKGSIRCRLAPARMLKQIAAVSPPWSLPTNNQFFRLCGSPHNLHSSKPLTRQDCSRFHPHPAITDGLSCPPFRERSHSSCAFVHERRNRCAFQPTLRRRAPRNAGWSAEAFAELPPKPAGPLLGQVRLCRGKANSVIP